MKQGASRHALRDRADDLYETPAVCIEAAIRDGIIPAPEDIGGAIWEPSAGRGAISRVLTAAGYTVVATDLCDHQGRDDGITTHVDFLMERRAPDRCAAIVTNPPFKLADEFIRHGLSIAPRVVVLLRAMAIEGASRSDLIDHHLRHYWIGIDRPPAMHREGWTGNRLSNSGAPFAWFDFWAEKRPPGVDIALHRIWWDPRKRKGDV